MTAGGIDDTEAAAATAGADAAASAAPVRSACERRVRLALVHALAGIATLSWWAAADAWQAATGFGLASVLAVLAAIPAGVTLAFLGHEWSHLLGARLGGAAYTVPDRLGFFVYDYDFARNDVRQFFLMSYGGQIGGMLALLLLWWSVPLDTAGRAMLVCAALGFVVFAVVIELPVLRRTRVSGNPGAELALITREAIQQATHAGIAAGLLAWLVLA